ARRSVSKKQAARIRTSKARGKPPPDAVVRPGFHRMAATCLRGSADCLRAKISIARLTSSLSSNFIASNTQTRVATGNGSHADNSFFLDRDSKTLWLWIKIIFGPDFRGLVVWLQIL